MPIASHTEVARLPAGWVQRTYPKILETWPSLTDSARLAAQHLFSLGLQPGDLTRVVHRQFYKEIGRRNEGASRRAFDCLEEFGLVGCVCRGRGRYALSTYRLGDPLAAYQRHGVGLHAPDPQLLLPFATDEPVDEQDLGGGVIRLIIHRPDVQCGASAALESAQSGADCALNAQSGASAALNATQSGASAALNATQSGASAALNFDGTPGSEENPETLHAAETPDPGGMPGAVRTAADSTESTTRQRIEASQQAPAGGRSVHGMEAAGVGPDTTPPPSFSPHDNGNGAPVATHAGAPISISIIEDLYPSNSIPTPIQEERASGLPARAPGEIPDDEPGEEFEEVDFAGYAEQVDDAKKARADKWKRKLLQAVRRHESVLAIASAAAMNPWLASEFAKQIVAGAFSPQHVAELIEDLDRTAEGSGFTNSPGAFVNHRFKKLYYEQTGTRWKHRRKAR